MFDEPKSVEKDFDQSNFNRNIQFNKNGKINNIQSIAHAVFTLAKDIPSERIAPAFVDVYNADWIVQP